jgi:hypothetical protein
MILPKVLNTYQDDMSFIYQRAKYFMLACKLENLYPGRLMALLIQSRAHLEPPF